MRVLILVFFNAPLGGLQAHVRSQARALKVAGNDVVVVCKPGPFAISLQVESIEVIETDFHDLLLAISNCLEYGPFDIVHAHPFASRSIGLEIAQRCGAAFVVTFHGTYDDSLAAWCDDADLLVAVSPAIRDYLCQFDSVSPEKVIVIANGVDTLRFFKQDQKDALERLFPHLAKSECIHRVLIASRLDEDKRVIIDAIVDAFRCACDAKKFDIEWWVAGDGSLRSELEDAAKELSLSCGKELVRFLGWQDDEGLAILYNCADLAIAPGRCALEAMACGTPVIAIGSRRYIGVLDSVGLLAGKHGNFGSVGYRTYVPGMLFIDVDGILDGAIQVDDSLHRDPLCTN